MGKVNLAWRRAAQTLRLSPGEVEAGWPETLTVEQIATLQSDDRKERRVITAQLVADCQTNKLAHTETYSHPGYKFIAPDKWIPLETVPYYAEEIGFDSSGKWRERYTVKRYKTIPSTSVTLNEKPKGYITTYCVTVPAIAQWMKDNGLVPSVNITAWFDAYGVAEQVVPQPETTTPEAAPLHAASATIANTVTVEPDATDGEESQLSGWMKYGFFFVEEISKEKPNHSANNLFDVIRARSKENTESPFSIDEKDKNRLIVNATGSPLKRSTFIGDWNHWKKKKRTR